MSTSDNADLAPADLVAADLAPADLVAAVELHLAEAGNNLYCLPIRLFDTFKVTVYIERERRQYHFQINCDDIEITDYNDMDDDGPGRSSWKLANSSDFAGRTGVYPTVAACVKAVLEFLQTAHFNKFDGKYRVAEGNELNNAKVLCAKVLEGPLFKRVKTSVSECCVCHEPTETHTPCHHFVCVSCISQLDCVFTNAGHMRKCPMCRADFGIVKRC